MQQNGTEHRSFQKHLEIFEIQTHDVLESMCVVMYLILQNDDDDALGHSNPVFNANLRQFNN